jgi:uncharacterized protein (TIGR02246 family)
MRSIRRHAALLTLLALAACAAPAPAGAPAPAADAAAITDVLVRSTEGWNRRDLDAFMEAYADDGTFVGARGLMRGRAAVRESYATSWFSPGRDPGQLRFADIEVRMLGRDHALAVGRFIVDIPGRDTATGLFSLTMRRTPDGWRILHDHSS